METANLLVPLAKAPTLQPSIAPSFKPSFRPTPKPTQIEQVSIITTLKIYDCLVPVVSDSGKLALESTIAGITNTNVWSHNILNVTTMNATTHASCHNCTGSHPAYTMQAYIHTFLTLPDYPRFQYNASYAYFSFRHSILAAAMNLTSMSVLLKEKASISNATELLHSQVEQIEVLGMSTIDLPTLDTPPTTNNDDDHAAAMTKYGSMLILIVGLSIVGCLICFMLYLCFPRRKKANTFQVYIRDI